MRGEDTGADTSVRPWHAAEGAIWDAVNGWTDVMFWGIKLTEALRYDLQQIVYKVLEAEKEKPPCVPVS